MIDAAAAASSPEVGSSRKTTRGFLHSATPSESRRFCPPDNPLKNWFPAFTSATPSIPVCANSFCTNVSRSEEDSVGWVSAVAKSRCSFVVRKGQSVSLCATFEAYFM